MKELIKHILVEFKSKSEVKEFARYDYSQQLDNSAVSRILFKIVEEYNNQKNPFYKRLLKEQAEEVMRKWTSKPPKYASQKVLERFLSNENRVNPFVIRRGAKKQLRGKNKSIIISDLVWEHTVPVNITMNKVFKSKNDIEVLKALDEGSDTCWVTKEEDDCLNSKGFRKSRPDNWREAYSQCGIIPLTKEEFKSLYEERNPKQEFDINNTEKGGSFLYGSKQDRLKPKKDRIEIANNWVEFFKNNGIPARQPNKHYPEYVKLGNKRENVKILFGSEIGKLGIVLENYLYSEPQFQWIVSNPQIILDYLNKKFPNLKFEVSKADLLKTFKFNFNRFDISQENLNLLIQVISEFQKITKIPNLL